MLDLGTLGRHSIATALNDQGQVVGYSGVANGLNHAFLWSATAGMRDLGSIGNTNSRATAINSHGQVMGVFGGLLGSAFSWTQAGGITDIGALSSGPYPTTEAWT